MDSDGHCERFNELPEGTKKFLEELTPEKIARIEKGIKLADAAETVGRFWKWTAIFVVALFAGMATLGQSILWLWNWIRGT